MYNLKIALRNLLKQKSSGLINFIGLSLSLAVCLVIILFIQYELQFDKHNINHKNIYRLLKVTSESREPQHEVILYGKIRSQVSGIKESCMVQYRNRTDFINYNNQQISYNSKAYTTDDFFKVFTTRFIRGGALNVLSSPDNIILTKSLATRIFGNLNPMGQFLKLSDGKMVTVSGVIDDFPATSHIRPELIMSINQFSANKSMMESWNQTSTCFYFVPEENANIRQMEINIRNAYKQAREIQISKRWYALQPLDKIHLYSANNQWDTAIRGDIRVVKSFAWIAFFILCIACFNYINISLANSKRKMFITGIQKTMGATKKTIFNINFIESLLLVLICLTLAIGLMLIVLPLFNQIMDTDIHFRLDNMWILIAIPALLFISVFIPSWVQSIFMIRITPVEILSAKGKVLRMKGNGIYSYFTQGLTILQLTISIALIIGLIVINRQTSFVLDEKAGFNKSQLLVIDNPFGGNESQRINIVKEAFSKLPFVKGVSASWNVPGQNLNNYSPIRIVGKTEASNVHCAQNAVDGNFFNVLEAPFIAGRGFDKNLLADSNKVVVNRTAQRMLEKESAVGERIHNFFIDSEKQYEIIGVIEDVQYQSLQEETKPCVYFLTPWTLHQIIVRMAPGSGAENIKQIENTWKRVEPNYAFSRRFVDDILQANYKKDIQTRKIISIMTVLAILLSMLGLLGLITLIAQSRIKEIGVRKVNGAKILEILTLLNKNFVLWVLIAFVLATPIAYYAMQTWLQNFAYKTALSWWIFALAGLIALAITLLTVSWQSWHAATRNPVEALRYE